MCWLRRLQRIRKGSRKGYDPTKREQKERLRGEFEVSVDRLRPGIERIEKTDWLIDQVVYRLYGLSEEEIRVVEGVISEDRTK